MNKDEFNITLKISGRPYLIPVRRGDEAEERLYRNAADRVEMCLLQYRQHFAKSLEEIDLLSMVAIQLARDVLLLEAQNDVEYYARKVQQLTKKMNDYQQKK